MLGLPRCGVCCWPKFTYCYADLGHLLSDPPVRILQDVPWKVPREQLVLIPERQQARGAHDTVGSWILWRCSRALLCSSNPEGPRGLGRGCIGLHPSHSPTDIFCHLTDTETVGPLTELRAVFGGQNAGLGSGSVPERGQTRVGMQALPRSSTEDQGEAWASGSGGALLCDAREEG